MNRFLRLARFLFAEATVLAVFAPAIADYQAEVREESSRVARLGLHWRWFWALIALLVVTPFTVSIPSITERTPAASHASSGGSLFVILYAALFAGAWWCVQEFTAAAIVAGLLLAVALRAWNDRHPASLAEPAGAPLPAVVQINFSSTRVPGDVAGLIFAAGTILIVVVGLPGLRWFFTAAALASVAVAWMRFRAPARGMSCPSISA